MNHLLRLTRTAVILASLLLASSAAAIGLNLGVRWDPNYPNKDIAGIWAEYLAGRINYRVTHKLIIPKIGVIEPVFREEVSGRSFAAQSYAAAHRKNPKVTDPYWDDVVKVRAAGFVPEYVWTYYRRPAWPEDQKPPRLTAFQNWQRQHLKNHQPQTHGAVIGKN